jgi:leader peptidase (prepilin peptidase)/N-methyltransferase
MSSYREIAIAFPWFWPMAAGIFGAIVGSFLNVCIYRIPAEKSIVTPGSQCACGQPIKWYDNIPVFSWFVLRGKARCCGRPYSFRYPFIELLTATLFLACWLLFPPGKAICGMVFVSVLIAATFIDLDHMIIPDAFTLGAGVVGVVLSMLVPALHGQHEGIFIIDSLRSTTASVQGLLVGSGLVLWIALLAEMVLKKEAMGFGDVKFVGMIGAFCGWKGAVFAVFGGAIVGTVWFVLALIWQKVSGQKVEIAPSAETPGSETAPLGFGMHVPFGPMLAIAGLLYFLFFHPLVGAYFRAVSELV